MRWFPTVNVVELDLWRFLSTKSERDLEAGAGMEAEGAWRCGRSPMSDLADSSESMNQRLQLRGNYCKRARM